MKLVRGHLYLVGFSGSGKSTVAARLGMRLNCPVVDMDERIEKRFKLTVPQIFDHHGEHTFRKAETALLRQISRINKQSVVATGGGCIERRINRLIMKQSGVVVYLRCSARDIGRRLQNLNDRPMLLQPRSRISAITFLLKRRKPLYSIADMTVSTSNRTVSQVVSRIVTQLKAGGYAG